MGSGRGNYFRLAELADVGRMKDEDEAPAIDDVPFPAAAAAAEERLELERDRGREPETAVKLPRLRRLFA